MKKLIAFLGFFVLNMGLAELSSEQIHANNGVQACRIPMNVLNLKRKIEFVFHSRPSCPFLTSIYLFLLPQNIKREYNRVTTLIGQNKYAK